MGTQWPGGERNWCGQGSASGGGAAGEDEWAGLVVLIPTSRRPRSNAIHHTVLLAAITGADGV